MSLHGRLSRVLFLLAPALLGQQYPFVPVANSPRNIEHIIQDRQGRIWVATHDDVLCFDGSRFFSLRELGLPAAQSALSDDLQGGILLANGHFVYHFSGGRLERIFAGPVTDALTVAPGIILAAVFPTPSDTSAQLYRITNVNSAWKSEQLAGWQGGVNLTRDNSGAIITTCPGGWCEMPANLIADWSPGHPTKPLFHPSGLAALRVARDRVGCVWFRWVEGGAYQCRGDAEPVRLPAAVAGRNISASEEEDASGSMLFANVASLAYGRPGSFQVVTPASGLPPVAVTCAVRARDGSIWVGSIGGLYRFPYPFRMQYWRSTHGLVWSFARSGNRIVAGTSAGVAYLSGDGEWNVLKGSSEFGSVSSVVPDPQGNIYAAVTGEGVIQLAPDGSLAARTPLGQGGQARKLARTRDGQIWLSGESIYRVMKRGGDLLLEPENVAGDSPPEAHIALDRLTGDLWACDAGGLMRRDAGKWRRITRRDELPEKACISLAFQPNGDAWLGYAGLNASFLVHSGTRNEATVRQIQTTASFFLGLDARGWVWRGTADGIHVADPAQAAAGVWLHLNEVDSLVDVDANRDSFFSDADGSVWWGADASIVHFLPPSDLVHPDYPPPIFLSAFSVNGAAPRLAETLHEFPNGKKLTAHIGSLQFERRSALRLRYRLLPEQPDWREPNTLDLNLGTPSWGTHTLEIQSRFSMGPWSGSLRRSFPVLRPWWFSWPAVLAVAGLGLGGTAGGAAWRRKQRARANTSLPDLADWRLAALSPESQWVGTTIDRRYKALELVARGGFATVLKGRDLRHRRRQCAIKIFRRDVIDEQWLTHRFQQEVSALEQIRHPSVVSIYGHGITAAGAPYLVMEFIEGGTLRDLLESGPLPVRRAAGLLQQAAGALDQIHARGIYHRDLKPENLMLRNDASTGELVLIDFSIAIVKDPDQTMHGLSRAAGTIYYMAPEQAVGFATPASDIYSLAKILLEMLTGQRLPTLLPHANMDLPDRVRELVRSLPIPLSAHSVDLIGSALEFDPSRRPQSALPFAEPIARDLSAAACGPSAKPGPFPGDDEPAASS